MRRRTLTIAVLAVLATGGVAHAISTKQYVKRVDKVCKDANARLRKIAPPKSEQDIAPLLRRTLSILRPAQRKLEAVPLPSGRKRASAREAVKVSRQGVDHIAATSRKIDRGADPSATVAAAESKALRLAKRESSLWRKVGAKHCSAV